MQEYIPCCFIFTVNASLKQVKEKESDLKAAEQRLIEDQERIREQGAEDKKALDKQRLLLVRFKHATF